MIDPETCFRRDIDVLMRLQVEKIFEDWKKLLTHEELFLFNWKKKMDSEIPHREKIQAPESFLI